ncbi:hypothetical protein [Aureibaculum luteum]|uniref:hypothetical protein n=1 Tax=Aureibaculum luteum TaxID=1548456 RepID=UPI000E4A9618|nr:hypothetical protein [Aureibaculum luteum]
MDNSAQQNGIFKTLQIIYGALIAGIVVFSVVAFILIDTPVYDIDITNIFTIVVPIMAVGSIFFSDSVYQSMVKRISPNNTLNSKLAQYQIATIVKGAWLEAPALIAIVAAFQSNNIIFLFVSILMAVIMYLKFPKKEIFKQEVKLSFEEKTKFDRF